MAFPVRPQLAAVLGERTGFYPQEGRDVSKRVPLSCGIAERQTSYHLTPASRVLIATHKLRPSHRSEKSPLPGEQALGGDNLKV